MNPTLKITMHILMFCMLGVSTAYCQHVPEQSLPTFTTILDKDRGYSDYVPFDIAYIPSLFSVRHQMMRYGVSLPAHYDGTGYEFAQLSKPVYAQVSALLQELGFDVQALYILRLNPVWRTHTTTVIATNACVFIDEEEWLALDHPLYLERFTSLAREKGWTNLNPIHEIKKYILKRALAHHEQGTYRKKVASKLVVGAALGFVAYKSMSQLTEYVSGKDADIGLSQSVREAAPLLTSFCSTFYITLLATRAATSTLSSIIGDQMRSAFHAVCTRPYWRYLDRSAEHEALAEVPVGSLHLLACYNASQAVWKKKNALLEQEYSQRAQYIQERALKLV